MKNVTENNEEQIISKVGDIMEQITEEKQIHSKREDSSEVESEEMKYMEGLNCEELCFLSNKKSLGGIKRVDKTTMLSREQMYQNLC
ncbi:MAG: hypothetical protein NTY48_06045 [Candidatus Diapherotrites archaeon]|nr:hypothetical protein [Candidatus Diapherotrites archaeon]